jgi:hypothetical protein
LGKNIPSTGIVGYKFPFGQKTRLLPISNFYVTEATRESDGPDWDRIQKSTSIIMVKRNTEQQSHQTGGINWEKKVFKKKPPPPLSVFLVYAIKPKRMYIP